MIKKLIVSSLIVMSIIGIMPLAASAQWKENTDKSYSWLENGVETKGWDKIGSDWYNFGDNGIMKTGWMMDNGDWYYCWSNGTMASNSWLTNGGFWYYFDASGKMITDSVIIDDRKYDFGAPAVIISEDATTSAAVKIN